MKTLQEYWASTVIVIGIFSQCTQNINSNNVESLSFRNKKMKTS